MNKHITIALIVAPILALISYFSVDYFVSEVPHKLKKGNYYTFLVKSNCRWDSGHCTLTNGNIKLQFSTYTKNKQMFLLLNSSTLLDSVTFSITEANNNNSFQKLMQTDDFYNFNYLMPEFLLKNKVGRLVVFIKESIFYATVPLNFIKKDTLK
ncbi:hypothetical protein MNB_SUP05-5-439 [hydrothermal vent metagenome]|uniref:Uncharacterized protein n=1 Tax=hydrothermal vent metagenome TaxID=652676 RepID=A0A1W1CV74_9ZZZZ